ncbi:hypothetical protein [Micromonospora sp. WMMD737]|uniref:hypothetical protein n=1 Tax=Micromonospora sp. WMMD737 TaxID=3404113 RepID=UPI003B94B28A
MTGLRGWLAARRHRHTDRRRYGYHQSQQQAIGSRLARTSDPHGRARLLLALGTSTSRLAALHNQLHDDRWIDGEERSVGMSLMLESTLYRALSDVETAAAYGTARLPTIAAIEAVAGPVLDKMAASPVLRDRMRLLGDLADAVTPVVGDRAAGMLVALPSPAGTVTAVA